jgi:predicted PurR-regulated permease PerM
VLIALAPLWLFGQILYNEANHLYESVQSGQFVISQDQIIASVPPEVQSIISKTSVDVNGFISQFTSNAFSSITGLLSNVFNFFVSLFILLFVIFYLMRDGDKIKGIFMDLSPIDDNQEQILLTRIISAVNGVVKGQFLVAVCQAIAATIGFSIFGVPQPFLWGLFVVAAALIPFVGTSLVMVPVILYLFVTGHTPQAIGLAIWAGVIVSSIDNLVAPKLVGKQLELHPLLIMLAVLGGVQFFGILGLLLGPILMAIFLQMIDVYRTDFKDYVHGSK